MLQEQLTYLAAAQNRESLFYDFHKQKGKKKHYHLKGWPHFSWHLRQGNFWYYCLYQPDKLPVQGWKIHLSCTKNQAQEMLNRVTPFLFRHHLSFKFVANSRAFLEQNAKYADRGSSGKFITIYPHDEQEFSQLLPKLKSLTANFQLVPYILSDQCWQESNVYFRYGGFQAIYKNDTNGNKIPAIYTPKGQLITDKRLPYYHKPNFVQDPPILKQNQGPQQSTFEPLLRYQVQSALHFSNAGGVYLAKKNGQKFILKEGRAQAGLDANGTDGFTRVEQEAKNLRLLKNVSTVVNLHDEFTAWRHHYLVEELVDGQTLDDLLPVIFPFIFKEDKKKEKYQKLINNVLCQLRQSLQQIHQHGLAVGDLSLSNIMLTKTGKIKLIDFESAAPLNQLYQPGLMTPGFIPTGAVTYKQADTFALWRIAFYLFLPICPVAELAPGIIKKQEKWIKNYFGLNTLHFLNLFKPKFKAGSPLFIKKYLTPPTRELNTKTITSFKKGLTRGIENHLHYHQIKLVPGNPGTTKISPFSFNHGATGIFWALAREGKLNKDCFKWSKWQQTRLVKVAKATTKLGLLNGLSGIINVCQKLGWNKLTSNLLTQLINKVNLKSNDLSLGTGLAGIGLTLAKQHQQKLVQIISDELWYRWQQLDLSYFAKEDAGLLTGWSGVSLMFWQLRQRRKALTIFKAICDHHLQRDQHVLVTDHSQGFTRLIPYLENGLFGLALLLHYFLRCEPDLKTHYQTIFNQLRASCFNYCTYLGTTISGFAGVLPLAASLAKEKQPALLQESLAGLNNYLIQNKNEIFCPGNFGYKVSLGFADGNAGLLTMLQQVQPGETEFSWLPI